MKALLVDDDEIVRTSLAALLQRVPAIGEVVEAGDGEHAWELLQAGLRPAVCCCDLVMPRLDGIGLLQRTRESPVLASIPFLMISAAADRESVTRAIACGASGFIVKPFSPNTVLPSVERVLRKGGQGQREPATQVCQRLGVSQEQLVQMTRRWRTAATTVLDGLNSMRSEDDRQQALRKLHSASVTLGQWRCGELLKQAIDSPGEAAGAHAQLRELLLADDWLTDSA